MPNIEITGDHIVDGPGSRLSLDDLGVLAEKLPWVAAKVFIMPPHEYVDERKLQSEEDRETFAALRVACADHPDSWRAFFRAYKAKNKYLNISGYRYWYSQIGPVRMMNRSDRNSELENIRGGKGERAITKWSGRDYAWKLEYGLQCENLHRYCNLVAVDVSENGLQVSIVRYAAMVSREAVHEYHLRYGERVANAAVEMEIRKRWHGVEAIAGQKDSRSTQVKCSDAESGMGAVWMRQKDMDPGRVATDLRWFSTAPRLEVESVLPLDAGTAYLVQLNVPAVA